MCFGGSHQIWKLGIAQTSHPNMVGIRVFTSTLELTAGVDIPNTSGQISVGFSSWPRQLYKFASLQLYKCACFKTSNVLNF